MDSDFELDYIEEVYTCDVQQPLKKLSNRLDAELIGRPIPVKVGFKKSRPCPICEVRAKVVKRHAI